MQPIYWRDYQKDGVPALPPRPAGNITALVLCDISSHLDYTLEGLFTQESQGFDMLFYDTYDHQDPTVPAQVLEVARRVKTDYTLLLVAGACLYPCALSALLEALDKEGGDVLSMGERYVNRVENRDLDHFELDENEAYEPDQELLPMTLLVRTSLLVELLTGMQSRTMYHLPSDLFLAAEAKEAAIRRVPYDLLEQSWYVLVLSYRESPLPFSPAHDGDFAFVVLANHPRRAVSLAKRLARQHPAAPVTILYPQGMRLGMLPGRIRRQALPPQGLVAGLEALLPTLPQKAVVVMQDSISRWEKDAFSSLAGCVLLGEVTAASPFVYDTDDKVSYAGATTAGATQYWPLFRRHGRDYAQAINIVSVVREIGILGDECFCVAPQKLKSQLSLSPGITSLREWVVELSLQNRAAGSSNVYCGRVQLGSLWPAGGPQNGLWGSGTGRGICRWFAQYPALIQNDPHCPLGVTRGDTHLGPSLCLTDPGQMQGEGSRGRVLAVSHEMTLTGAPLVLVKAMRVLQEEGWDVVCVAPKSGPMRDELIRLGISVIIDPATLYGVEWQDVGPGFDLVLPNTILPYQAAGQLSGQPVPVLWWVHDAEAGYAYYDGLLPQNIGENVHVYCTGGHALKVLQKYRPAYQPQNLFYGIEDLAAQAGSSHYDLSRWAGKMIFATVGSMEYRKGPDIFADAIGLLPAEVRKKCAFLFVGRPYEADMVAAVKRAAAHHPEVHYIENISRQDIPAFFEGIDCVVCASRDDPLPVFITEGMMFSKVTICSENTGTALIIEDGTNGFTYPGNSAKALAERLEEVALHLPELSDMRRKSRETYETYFTTEVFRQNLLGLMAQLTGQ